MGGIGDPRPFRSRIGSSQPRIVALPDARRISPIRYVDSNYRILWLSLGRARIARGAVKGQATRSPCIIQSVLSVSHRLAAQRCVSRELGELVGAGTRITLRHRADYRGERRVHGARRPDGSARYDVILPRRDGSAGHPWSASAGRAPDRNCRCANELGPISTRPPRIDRVSGLPPDRHLC
jgi:hypothetical protein